MQLPPTIVSRRASDLGLSKSMHDRLMNDCDEEYFMLVRNSSSFDKILPCVMCSSEIITYTHYFN